MERRCGCIFRICQLVQYIDELGDTARPAVRQEQWSGIRARGSSVQEMDSEIVNYRAELADPVEARFERPPVVSSAPIVHDIDEVGERNALFPSASAGRAGRWWRRSGCRRAR